MKKHYYILPLDEKKDDMFGDGMHSTQCGKRIPFKSITNDIDKVECLNCLKSIIKSGHDGIKDFTRAINQFSRDIWDANWRLQELSKSNFIDEHGISGNALKMRKKSSKYRKGTEPKPLWEKKATAKSLRRKTHKKGDKK